MPRTITTTIWKTNIAPVNLSIMASTAVSFGSGIPLLMPSLVSLPGKIEYVEVTNPAIAATDHNNIMATHGVQKLFQATHSNFQLLLRLHPMLNNPKVLQILKLSL